MPFKAHGLLTGLIAPLDLVDVWYIKIVLIQRKPFIVKHVKSERNARCIVGSVAHS